MTETTEDKEVFSIFDVCETDTKAEEEGRWFRDIFNDGTNIDVKLRRLSSKASLAARRVLDKTHRKHVKKDGTYPDDIAMKVLILQMAEGVIVDWDGINDNDKKPIACMPATAEMLLTRLTKFRETIVMLASQLDNFRLESREEDVKN